MNSQTPLDDAMRDLRAAGYFVEYNAMGIVYARKKPNGVPDRLYITKNALGKEMVSTRVVKTLIGAINAKVSG